MMHSGMWMYSIGMSSSSSAKLFTYFILLLNFELENIYDSILFSLSLLPKPIFCTLWLCLDFRQIRFFLKSDLLRQTVTIRQFKRQFEIRFEQPERPDWDASVKLLLESHFKPPPYVVWIRLSKTHLDKIWICKKIWFFSGSLNLPYQSFDTPAYSLFLLFSTF